MTVEEFYAALLSRLDTVRNCEYGWNKPAFVQGVDSAIRAATELIAEVQEDEEDDFEVFYEEDYYPDDFYDGDDDYDYEY